MSDASKLVSTLSRITIAAVFILVLLWLLWEGEGSVKPAITASPLLNVTTLLAHAQRHTVKIEVTGTTEPRWPLQVVSAVEGRVKQLPVVLEPGARVSDDSLLLEIEPAAYAAALASAQASIEQAQLELARIEHEKTVVEQISNNNKLSDFGRFIPHLASARANLTAARASQSNAQQRLAETRFMAPFPAIVLDRRVVPGQWVNMGDVLFSLAASESMDVTAELSSEQLNKLGVINQHTRATVTDHSGSIWQAQLRFVAPDFSRQTRQKRVVFFVESPYAARSSAGNTALSPNATVSLTIRGKELAKVFVLPASVLTPDGEVWVVKDQMLSKESVTIEQEYQDKVYLRFQSAVVSKAVSGTDGEAAHNNAVTEIVRYPLSTMLNGQKVVTRQEGSTRTVGEAKQ